MAFQKPGGKHPRDIITATEFKLPGLLFLQRCVEQNRMPRMVDLSLVLRDFERLDKSAEKLMGALIKKGIFTVDGRFIPDEHWVFRANQDYEIGDVVSEGF